MSLLLLFFACAPSVLQASLALEPGSAEASQAARPDWSQAYGFAPGLTQQQLGQLDGEAHTGDLRGGLLRCAVTSRVTLPTPPAEAWLYTDGLGVRTVLGEGEPLVAAPSMWLRTGDRLQMVLQSLDGPHRVPVDTLHGVYDGGLPLTLQGSHTQASCARVPAAQVATALAAALHRADETLSRLEDRAVMLEQPDFGQGIAPDPRMSLEPAAALVGWAHPDVQARLLQIQSASHAFQEQVRAAVQDALVDPPEAVSVEGRLYRLNQSVCPPLLGYWQHGLGAACAIELSVSAGEAVIPKMDLVFSDGNYRPVSLWAVPEGAHALVPAAVGGISDESGLLLIRYEHEDRPMAVRIRAGADVHWLALSTGE